MPTGYTCYVQDGKIDNLKDYMLICARAFGATIEMRDEPLSKPIPKEFKADTSYHEKGIEDAKEELQKLLSLSLVEAELRAEQDYNNEIEHYNRTRVEQELFLTRYKNMLREVEKWQPPTSQHVNLKEFAIDQLSMSIKQESYPYDEPTKLSGLDWMEKAIKYATWNLDYHTRELANKKLKTEDSNKWINALRESFDD